MDDVVKFVIFIFSAAITFGGLMWLLDWHRDRKDRIKRMEAEREQMDAARREHEWQQRREEFRRLHKPLDFGSGKYASHAPNARATVLKMRKDEAAPRSEAIADAIIAQAMYSQSLHGSEPVRDDKASGGSD